MTPFVPLLKKNFFHGNQFRYKQKTKFKITINFFHFFKYWLNFNVSSSQNIFFGPYSTIRSFNWSCAGGLYIINIKNYFYKWKTFIFLLYNLLYTQEKTILFSTKLFIEETLIFNKQTLSLSYLKFKFFSSFFFLSQPDYGLTTSIIFDTILQDSFHVSIITNTKWHEKTLYHLKRINSFTISLTPINQDPWLYSYSLPTPTRSFITEVFFHKLVFNIQKLALKDSQLNSHNIWKKVKHF